MNMIDLVLSFLFPLIEGQLAGALKEKETKFKKISKK